MSNAINLARLSLSWKVLLSGFVIILGSGYLAAVFNAALSVGMNPQAISAHYGDKTVSPAEAAAIAKQGFAEEEFSLDDEEETSSMPMMQGMAKGKMAMHHGASGMMGDDTLPPQILAQVSHIHLLAFSLLLLSMGGLVCLTQLVESSKVILVSILFAGLWGDIISLNLVRFVSGNFAYMTVAMGTIIGLSFAFIIFRVLWELWLMNPAEKNQ